MEAPGTVEAISTEVVTALDARKQIAPIAARHPGFDLSMAYEVTARIHKLRASRGERPVGRKLGFTNSNIWNEYRVYAPIWGYMYDTTVKSVDPAGTEFNLTRVVEPRIEPEITLSLKRAPEAGMNEAALLECIDWVAHGFEVVQSLFPGWVFEAADTVAACGLHGALMLGPKHAVTAANASEWEARLTSFEVKLVRNGTLIDTGHARNVLGGPLSALRNVVEVLSQDKFNAPLAAGEFITTGTVTRAFPIAAGDVWSTEFSGAPFEGLKMRIV